MILFLIPFCGVASSGVAAVLRGRRFLGGEMESEYVEIAQQRLESAANKTIRYRPAERAIYIPNSNAAEGIRPSEFAMPTQGDLFISLAERMQEDVL